MLILLLFNGCANLLDIGGNWNTLSYMPIQSFPNMFNGWHVWWVCRSRKNWDIFSFQELCTDPAAWSSAWSCWNMRWLRRMNGMTTGLMIPSQLIVEKWTFNSQVTELVDIPAVSMPIACFLKTWDICGIVLCDKTANFRVAFYCPQHKVHLCNNHGV